MGLKDKKKKKKLLKLGGIKMITTGADLDLSLPAACSTKIWYKQAWNSNMNQPQVRMDFALLQSMGWFVLHKFGPMNKPLPKWLSKGGLTLDALAWLMVMIGLDSWCIDRNSNRISISLWVLIGHNRIGFSMQIVVPFDFITSCGF